MSYGIEDLDEDNAESVEKSMDSFLQTTGSHLTNRGIKEMDAYAQKGWDILESKGTITSRLRDISCPIR